jgi:putative phosphoesterase
MEGVYLPAEADSITLGVIGDTHVPDRRRALDARILPLLRSRNVGAILHTGDVSAQHVLDELGQVAPVFAVKGNRDWLWLGGLPLVLLLNFNGASIALAHGHGGWLKYILDKPAYSLRGVDLRRAVPRLQSQFPTADAVVFGHLHLPFNQRINGQLFFNPGSPHFPHRKHNAPSLGFLHIQAGGEMQGEIIRLDGQPIHSAASA